MTLGCDLFQNTTSQKFILLIFSFYVSFVLAWNILPYLSEVGGLGKKSKIAGQGANDLRINTDKCVLMLTFFLWMRFYRFSLNPENPLIDEYGEVKGEETSPRINGVLVDAWIILYCLFRRLRNMNGLFQSISKNIKSIRNVKLDSKVNQAKISRKSVQHS